MTIIKKNYMPIIVNECFEDKCTVCNRDCNELSAWKCHICKKCFCDKHNTKKFNCKCKIKEHRTMAYLLKDVMKNKLNRPFYQEDLWKYVENKKIEEYNMEDIKHWVYTPCWSYNIDNTECFYSIYQVLLQKNKFKKDVNKIKKADTSYPLIIIENEFDKYGIILDGNHRFAKLIINNNKKIQFKFISLKELDNLGIKV